MGFEVAYWVPSNLGKLSDIESKIHNQLGPAIRSHNDEPSEWFVGYSQDAFIFLDEIFKILGYEVTDYFEPCSNKVVRFWEEGLKSFYQLRGQ